MSEQPAPLPPLSTWHDNATNFGLRSRLLHWITAGLVAMSFVLAWTWFIPGPGPAQILMVEFHRFVGIVVLLITLARILLRLVSRPKTLSDSPFFIRISARFVQSALLLLLVALPLTGWAYTNAGGFDVTVLNFSLPHLVPRDTYLTELFLGLHERLELILIALLCAHAVGAILHYSRRQR